MKILIFGANGRLGSELSSRLLADGHQIVQSTRADCDLVHATHIPSIIYRENPDVVINAAARNGLETCQKHPFKAMQVNASAPSAMASACKSTRALLIHFSTDYVFSGDALGLYENTPTKPWGVYGRTKLWGEEAVAWCAGRYFVFRLSSLYGRDCVGVLEPINQVKQGKGTASNPVKVLHQFCAPTPTTMVASAVTHILRKHDLDEWMRLRGVYHLATTPRKIGESGVSKVQFTKHLLGTYYGTGPAAGGEWHVIEGTLPEPRPVYSVLKVGKFEETFGYRLPNWREAFAEMLPLLPKAAVAATV